MEKNWLSRTELLYGKEKIEHIIYLAETNDFLQGYCKPKRNSERFTANLDWLMKPNNAEKVLSGHYADDQHQLLTQKEREVLKQNEQLRQQMANIKVTPEKLAEIRKGKSVDISSQ